MDWLNTEFLTNDGQLHVLEIHEFPPSGDESTYFWERKFWIKPSPHGYDVIIPPNTIIKDIEYGQSISMDWTCIPVTRGTIQRIKTSKWKGNILTGDCPHLKWPSYNDDITISGFRLDVDVNLNEIKQVVRLEHVYQLWDNQQGKLISPTLVDFSYHQDKEYQYGYLNLETNVSTFGNHTKMYPLLPTLPYATEQVRALVKGLATHVLDGDKIIKGLISQNINVSRHGKMKLTNLFGSGWDLKVEDKTVSLMVLIELVDRETRFE